MIALIDGDVLCYHACRSRFAKTKTIENEVSVVRLDPTTGKRLEVEYTREEDQQYLMDSWDEFKLQLQEILDSLFTKNYMMAVKSPTNFRDDMYPEYKKQRKDSSTPNIFVPVLRELAVREGFAIAAHGREADDLLRIWAMQAKEAGDPYTICSIDKDLKCIPGKFFNMKTKTMEDISYEDAKRHYYEQLLKGDPTDNIPGILGVGNVKATKMLAHCQNTNDFQEAVVDAYMQAYGDGWADMLLSNGKMIHLQKTPDDYFNFREWAVVQEFR